MAETGFLNFLNEIEKGLHGSLLQAALAWTGRQGLGPNSLTLMMKSLTMAANWGASADETHATLYRSGSIPRLSNTSLVAAPRAFAM
jgi:hypothetical protein